MMFGALTLIAIGTGLFKGNLQVMVGNLYDDPKYSAKRDAAFSLFYMAINVGSMFAPSMAKAMTNWSLNKYDLVYNANIPALAHQCMDGTITADNIFAMWQRSLFQNRSKMIWLAHPDTEMQLQKLTFNDEAIWMPEGGLSASPYQRVLGRPVIYDDNMAALGAKGDIALVDLSQYLLLKKGSAKQDWSMHVEFLTDQMCFRMVLRCNGAPKVNAPLKIKNSSLTRSPFITLAARG